MYGTFFFLSQFLQDVQGYSPLVAGVAFLPMPASVFLGSQLTSRVLVQRLRPKVIMLSGVGLAGAQLAALEPAARRVLLSPGAGKPGAPRRRRRDLAGEPDVGVLGRRGP